MPGKKDTLKSLLQVQEDLQKELLTNARNLLKDKFGTTVTDETSLEDVLKATACAHFKKFYDYDFNEKPTDMRPKNSVNHKQNQCAFNFCSIVPPLGDQIANYLTAGVFSKVKVPEWIGESTKTDIIGITKAFVDKDTEKQWQLREYSRSYDSKKEEKESFQCDSVLVYVNGSLIEDGTQAQLCVIYYAGAYYNISSESKGTRDTIQHEAFTSAAALAKEPTIPDNDQKLEDTLTKYATEQFKKEFKYDYNKGAPADSYRAHGVGSAMLNFNKKLCYIQDFNTASLKDYIEHHVFSGLNIQLNNVLDKAVEDTESQFKSILQNASIGSWGTTLIDHTYTSSDPLHNPIHQSAFIMSWYGQKKTSQDKDVSVTYIYIMTVFYEKQSLKTELSQELFKQMCNNLRVHPKVPGTEKAQLDAPALKEFLHDYAKEQWKHVFEFDFDGNFTNPPDKKPGTKVESYQELLHLPVYPVTNKDVEEWIDTVIFRRTDKRFPDFAMSAIYDDIRDHVVLYGSTTTPKDANHWYEAEHSREYFDPQGRKKDIKHYALFIYGLGEMALNEKVGSEEGVHTQQLFVYYLGVFSSFAPSD